MQVNIILIISLGLFCCINGTIKVPRIKPGDTIGFISPASPVSGHEKDIGKYKERVISSLMKLGLKVEWSKYAFGPAYGYFAATNEERAADVMSMFQNRNITAIISNRGGWGCDRIVELLDFEIIKNNPKALIGYSDLTTLINSIYHLTSIVTFHGPMGIDDWGVSVWNSIYFSQVMMEGKLATFSNQDNFPITTIKSGKARGILVGGNLCVYTSMMGSNYIPNGRNEKNTKFILFLEEVGEALSHVEGVVLGRFTDCDGTNFSVPEILHQHFSKLNIPVFSGAMIGHIHEQYTLPLGTLVEMDADLGTITMLESPVY